jgi:hypothetical protein
LKILFLSPISPNDLLRQSAPVSYLSVSVASIDGKEHDVNIYTDVSAGMYHEMIQQGLILIQAQNGPAETEHRRWSGHTALPMTLHTIDLPGRPKQLLANRVTKRSGEIGTMRHPIPTA